MLLIVLFAFIQGLTEFLPVSSQGHLITFDFVFNLNYLSGISILEANVLAHAGSLFAILFYYHSTTKNILFSIKNILRPDIEKHASLLIFLIFSTIPVILAGYFFGKYFDYDNSKMLLIIGFSSIIFGLLLFAIDKFCLLVKNFDNMNLKSSIVIGAFQCLALVPGVSRSGAVLTVMRAAGFNRDFSVFYSNMLSIPVLFGAITYLLSSNSYAFFLDNITNIYAISIFFLSFFFSIIFIHFLVVWVSRSSLLIFVVYRILFGLVLLGLVNYF